MAFHPAKLQQEDTQTAELLRTARARLYPRLSDPNYLVLRSRRIIFANWIEKLNGSQMKVLDVGGRYQPYRPLLADRTARYVGMDIVRTGLVDVVGSGEFLPFAAETFDLAIATQVFDYFEEPRRAALGIHRILKPGGVLLMSVASVAPRFAEGEYWRFTPSSIRITLSSFSRIEIIPETYSLGGLLRTANLGFYSMARFPIVRKIAEVTVCPFLNLLGLAVERLKLTTNDQLTPNFSVIAFK